ncbi:protoporphyrinogen oxidase [Desulfobacterota bacterium M19]
MENFYDVIIVGAGLSGLSAAHFLTKLSHADLRVTIIEKTSRPGGAIKTFNSEGYQGEWGPHGFLDNTPESQELLRDIDLYREAQQAPLGDFFRYMCHRGRLERLPQSLSTALNTPLVSMSGKLRLMADLWKRPKMEDQTIADWVNYRFGSAILPLADAAVSGTFAGDFNRLSIDAVMPGVRALEKETGSVLRGLIRKKRAAKGEKKLDRLPSMLNFPTGMERLVKALADKKEIKYNAAVKGIRRDKVWTVSTEAGEFKAARLIMALPVNQALRLLAAFKPPPVVEIPTARIINVVMGLPDSARVPYGFGYLAPEREHRFAVGAMFTSHMFPGRSPRSCRLIEVLVGGRRHPERLSLSDSEIEEQAVEDIRSLIDLPEPPLFIRVLRTEHAIPQLEMDHPALLCWRQSMETDFSNLYICGFGWNGIGMNDMIKSARKTAAAAAAGGERPVEELQVKPVYF